MNRRLIPSSLALLILGVGLFTFAYSLWIVIQTRSPTFYQDQWSIAFTLEANGGKLPLHALWDQHNEHRIPITQIACYIDLMYFGASNLFLLSVMWLSQIAHWGLFVFAVHRWGPRSWPFLATLAGFGLYTFFSPIQLDNLIWGFQIQFIQVGMFASLASFCLIVYWRRSDWKWLAFALGAAFLAEISLSSGMLIWPILFLLAIGLRLSKSAFAWIAAVAAVSMTLYLWGYAAVHHHGDPFATLRKPLELGHFVLNYLTFSWDKYLQDDPPSSMVWKALTIAAVCWALFEIVRGLIRGIDRARPLDAFCHALILFSLSAATLTAIGRVSIGQFLAFESRYQTVALLFWIAVATLAMQRLRRFEWVAQVVIVVLMLRGTTRFARLEAEADARQQALVGSYDTLAKGRYDDLDRYWWSYPDTKAAARTYQYMASNHLVASVNLGPHEYPAMPIQKLPRDGAYFCMGSFDFLFPPSGQRTQWIVNGWAWDATNAKFPDRLVVRYEDGTIASVVTQTGFPRSDVIRQVPPVWRADVGWRALIDDHPPGKIRVFASRGEGQTECLIGEREMAPPPK